MRVRELRKKLNVHLKDARKNGRRATIIFDHILIDGRRYSLDSDDALVEIK